MSDADGVLAAIRSAELEAARRVESAGSEAEARVAAAREEGRAIVAEARRRGEERAERLFDETVSEARRRAGEIRVEPLVGSLRESVSPKLGDLADAIVELTLAPPLEEEG